MRNDTFVVVVTYNADQYIRECVCSVGKYKSHTIVVDNASCDSTRDILEAECPEVTLLKQDVNLGFAAANNIGIAEAIRRGAKYVFLLNQDAKASPEAIEALADLLDRYPDFGLVGPIRFTYDGRELEWACRVALARHMVGRDFYTDLFQGNCQELYEVRFWAAAAIVVRCQALIDVNGFDSRFFMYAEDWDLCERARHAGWKVGVSPRCVVFHDHAPENRPRGLASELKLEARTCWRAWQSRWYRFFGFGIVPAIWLRQDIVSWRQRITCLARIIKDWPNRKNRMRYQLNLLLEQQH